MLTRIMVALTLLAAAIASPAHSQSQVQPDDRVVRNVVVRAGPSTATAAIDSLEPGESLSLIREVPNWYEVALPDGRMGYVSKAWTIALAGPAGDFRVHIIDIGTGLAIFVEGPSFTLLYDAGSQDDNRRTPRNRVLAYLRKVRPDLVQIDHLVLSHAHKDHISLFPDIFDALSIRNVWDSGRLYDSCGYRTFLQKVAAEPGVSYRSAIGASGFHAFEFEKCSAEPKTVTVRLAGILTPSTVQLGSSASMTFLHVDTALHDDPNENSLVLLLNLAGRKVLLTGDAEAGERRDPSMAPDVGSIEHKLLACCRAALQADVLVAGHHGSKTSSRSTFLDAVDAEVFIISSGPFDYHGTTLSDPEIETELRGRGTLLQTDHDDAACRINPGKIGVDGDGKVGGCDNIRIDIAANGTMRAAYHRLAD